MMASSMRANPVAHFNSLSGFLFLSISQGTSCRVRSSFAMELTNSPKCLHQRRRFHPYSPVPERNKVRIVVMRKKHQKDSDKRNALNTVRISAGSTCRMKLAKKGKLQ